jgi:uncharacterized damage-inducible protein DinB
MSVDPLRQQLLNFLRGGHAHVTFEDAVHGFPVSKAGVRPAGLPHSGWELLEHIRISQNDILRFCQSPDYASPKWPEGYWPSHQAPPSAEHWERSIESFYRDRAAFEELLLDPKRALHEPFPWGEGQTLLREALLIVNHNAYHLGQLVSVRRALGAWNSR